MKGFQIVYKVLTAFEGLPGKLTNLFGKSDVWWRSHGYAPRVENPLSNGNLSAVDHLLKFVDQYEASAPGAGKMLAEDLASELRARFDDCEAGTSDRDLRLCLMKEFYEAMQELDKSDLKDKTDLQLAATDAELAQIETQIGYARAHVRAEQKRREAGNVTKMRFGQGGRV